MTVRKQDEELEINTRQDIMEMLKEKLFLLISTALFIILWILSIFLNSTSLYELMMIIISCIIVAIMFIAYIKQSVLIKGLYFYLSKQEWFKKMIEQQEKD